MNKFVAAIILHVVALGIILIDGATWGDWRSLACNAKPCKCYNDEDKCDTGARLQIRGCIVGEDGIPCRYDASGTGPVRIDRKCTNEKVFCPGWSDWTSMGCGPNGKETFERLCNNPAPIYEDVLCETESGADYLKSELKQVDCEYIEPEEETTTTAATTTTVLPCCGSTSTASDVYPDYPDYPLDPDEFKEVKPTPSTTTTLAPEEGATLSIYDAALFAMYDEIVNTTKICDKTC